MQTLSEIRRLLEQAHLRPQKRFGQNFLIDGNLMDKLLALAEPGADQTVLEVGAGTGSLTEELLQRCGRVVAVEIDRGLGALLVERLRGAENLVLIRGDVLAGKHRINPAVLAALGSRAQLVANLPYNVATPLVAECLLASWRSLGRSARPDAPATAGRPCRFDRMSFTVQQEVAERIAAPAGGGDYGPISVLVGLLGRVRLGPSVPPTAFWPRPRVTSRMMRIDFDSAAAARLTDADVLVDALALVFGQRRKQIGSAIRRRGALFETRAFRRALDSVGIDPTHRAETVAPEKFLDLANALAAAGRPGR